MSRSRSRTSSSSLSPLPSVADEVAPRVDHLAGAVEVHRLVAVLVVLEAHPVGLEHEVAVGHGGAGALDLPQPVGEAGLGGVGVEHHVGAVEAELAPALGEVAVVADVHADLAHRGVPHRIALVAGAEVELLPELLHVRDVHLAVLAEDAAVGVHHHRGVVVDAGLLLLVDREDVHHAELLRERGEALHDRPVGRLGVAVVLLVLGDAEVGAVEELLVAHHLGALGGCVTRELLVPVEHRLLVAGPGGLADGGLHDGQFRPPAVCTDFDTPVATRSSVARLLNLPA